ncbi:hypothetical protein ACFV2H_34480 [Streptomyces sp. NPDC059629]|uniref:hypothetical protein n=1 Tax=Streptomyces sp. NPDC059629 TaxID=3346889 RepID=UPI0036CEF01E
MEPSRSACARITGVVGWASSGFADLDAAHCSAHLALHKESNTIERLITKLKAW